MPHLSFNLVLPRMIAQESAPAIAVYALTGQGLQLAFCLAKQLRVRVYAAASLRGKCSLPCNETSPLWFSSLREQVRAVFRLYACHIFISAAGIAVRVIAPLLQSKDQDPAVLVLDQRGEYVISLLSGHLGGANSLALRVAGLLDATPVITTATDREDLPALDALAQEKDLVIGNLEVVKNVSSALLAGEQVLLDDPEDRLGLKGGRWDTLFSRRDRDCCGAVSCLAVSESRVGICVTILRPPAQAPGRQHCLYLHPRVLCVGVGCRKGASGAAIVDAITDACAEQSFALASLDCLASLDIKRHEPGLAEAAKRLGLPLYFFSPRQLAAFPVLHPSPKARELFGVQGVCESAAQAAAARDGNSPLLLAGKRIFHGVAVALACRDQKPKRS